MQLIHSDDLLGHESGLFLAKDWLSTKFPTLISLLQLANRLFWDCYFCFSNVLCGKNEIIHPFLARQIQEFKLCSLLISAVVLLVLNGMLIFFRQDGLYATGCVGILIIIFLIIHYTSAPKSWGDVSQNLIYHQVRKYLLRLKQEHVKFWRPQILLFVNDPRRQYKLIQFCNSMKKGALYILGHVIVTDDFGGSVPEARRQQAAWTKYIDFSKIKAFVNIAISPAPEW
jgi:hypothetical protein